MKAIRKRNESHEHGAAYVSSDPDTTVQISV